MELEVKIPVNVYDVKEEVKFCPRLRQLQIVWKSQVCLFVTFITEPHHIHSSNRH